MKTRYNLLLLGLILSLGSCEIDNYEEPSAFFTGALTYEGDTVRVASEEVRFQLWQSGFGNEGPLDVYVAQNGTFSALLFNGDYRLDFLDGEGPFRSKIVNAQQGDTIFIDLNGDTNMNLEVMPYYMVRNAQFNLSGTSVQASADLEQVITGDDGKNIERVTLYLNDTRFVSASSDENVAASDADLSNLDDLDITVGIPDNYNKDYIFARIGVKIEGVEDMLYSRVEELAL